MGEVSVLGGCSLEFGPGFECRTLFGNPSTLLREQFVLPRGSSTFLLFFIILSLQLLVQLFKKLLSGFSILLGGTVFLRVLELIDLVICESVALVNESILLL